LLLRNDAQRHVSALDEALTAFLLPAATCAAVGGALTELQDQLHAQPFTVTTSTGSTYHRVSGAGRRPGLAKDAKEHAALTSHTRVVNEEGR
jgi:hypothetical protein